MMGKTALEAAVAAIDGWDVPAAAVIVVGRDGVLIARGDTPGRSPSPPSPSR
jgi:hypothetical protein